MINLIPAWAQHFDAFWDAIQRRNFWFIKLRYGAVIMLLMFLFLTEFSLGLTFSKAQSTALIVITIMIQLYNLILHLKIKSIKCDSDKFNPLHFSLLQMLLDLIALGLIVYYTGGIETPLFMLFIFHMIIGSLILPGFIINSIAVAVIFYFIALTFTEYFGLIQHQAIIGFLKVPLYNNLKFVIVYDTIFSFVMIMSVVLANTIANQLYKMEQQLVESIDKLNLAEVEKQNYVIGLVHEIKSPLVAVHSYLDVILQKFLGPVDKKVEEKLIRARARSDEAINMVNDVLKVSKLRLLDEISVGKIEIKELVQSLINNFQDAINFKNIRLDFFDNRKLFSEITGDKFLLEIAFSNLLSNAIKYVSQNGKIQIILSNNNSGIKLEFCDDGIGIPTNELPKIFNDFFRASNIKSKNYEGSGLGLSVVKHVIEKHGGKIEAISPSRLGNKNNPGSSFFIFLPA
ncbi:MAG: sensor histidine kinase [Ignavibacteriaceae bacterium]